MNVVVGAVLASLALALVALVAPPRGGGGASRATARDTGRDLRGDRLRPVRRHLRGPDLHRPVSACRIGSPPPRTRPAGTDRPRRAAALRRRARRARTVPGPGLPLLARLRARRHRLEHRQSGRAAIAASSTRRCPACSSRAGSPTTNGRTDDEIIADFARALAVDPQRPADARPRATDATSTGFSDSSDPVLRLVTSGRAAGVFDLALPFTAVGHDPQAALAAGRYGGKLIVVNSEAEAVRPASSTAAASRTIPVLRGRRDAAHPRSPGVPFFSNRTTPASYQPALRAHFLQGHDWVRGGRAAAEHPPQDHCRRDARPRRERQRDRRGRERSAASRACPSSSLARRASSAGSSAATTP